MTLDERRDTVSNCLPKSDDNVKVYMKTLSVDEKSHAKIIHHHGEVLIIVNRMICTCPVTKEISFRNYEKYVRLF